MPPSDDKFNLRSLNIQYANYVRDLDTTYVLVALELIRLPIIV